MKPRPTLIAGFASVGLVLAVSGCKTTVNTLEPGQPTAQREMLPDKRVITDASLNRRMRVLGINSITTPAGFLKIQIEVQNLTSSLKSCTYRIEWFDEHAMIINSATATALPLSLEGRETKSVTALAPTPMAKDFRIKFLEPVN